MKDAHSYYGYLLQINRTDIKRLAFFHLQATIIIGWLPFFGSLDRKTIGCQRHFFKLEDPVSICFSRLHERRFMTGCFFEIGWRVGANLDRHACQRLTFFNHFANNSAERRRADFRKFGTASFYTESGSPLIVERFCKSFLCWTNCSAAERLASCLYCLAFYGL